MDCIFCKIIKGDIPSYKIYDDEKIMAILDINPAEAGHVLVIPKEHTLDFNSISSNTLNYLMAKTKEIANTVTSKLDADGFSLVTNTGSVQEVKHFHLHIIPKYENKKYAKSVYEKITHDGE